MNDELLPESDGLLRCLQALSEETAALGLTRTHIALQQAIDICRVERRMPPTATTVAYVGLVH